MDTVKGIQYSYKVNYFNQVPTYVKTKVRNLPAISVPETTPLDRALRDSFISGNQPEPGVNTSINKLAEQKSSVTGTQQPEIPTLRPQAPTTPANARSIPTTEYNRAIRAYAIYDNNIKNNLETATSNAANTLNNALPAASSIKAINPLTETENKVEAAEAGRPEAPVTTGHIPERGTAAKPAKTEYTTRTEETTNTENKLTGENFLSRQAFNQYELVGRAGLLNTGNMVDFYF